MTNIVMLGALEGKKGEKQSVQSNSGHPVGLQTVMVQLLKLFRCLEGKLVLRNGRKYAKIIHI